MPVLPGADVLSLAALRKVKAFYDAGGAVIGTSLLAAKSAEFGEDASVREIVQSIFAIDPTKPMPDGMTQMHTNAQGGRAIFLRNPSPEALDKALETIKVSKDVAFSGNPTPTSGNGFFSYIHKVKDGMNIYFLGNSSDSAIATTVELRGDLKLQLWDPASRTIQDIEGVRQVSREDGVYTSFPLRLQPLSALVVVAR